MEHAIEPHRLTGLDTERHDVLDLEIDRIADAHTVDQAVVIDVDRARSTPNTSPTSGASAAIGPPSCPLKTLANLSNWSSLARSSMNKPRRQFPSVITLGASAMAATRNPPIAVPSTSPSRMLKANTTRQKS